MTRTPKQTKSKKYTLLFFKGMKWEFTARSPTYQPTRKHNLWCLRWWPIVFTHASDFELLTHSGWQRDHHSQSLVSVFMLSSKYKECHLCRQWWCHTHYKANIVSEKDERWRQSSYEEVHWGLERIVLCCDVQHPNQQANTEVGGVEKSRNGWKERGRKRRRE